MVDKEDDTKRRPKEDSRYHYIIRFSLKLRSHEAKQCTCSYYEVSVDRLAFSVQDEMHWALRHIYYCCHALRSPGRRLRNPFTDRDHHFFRILNLDVQFLILHLL